MYSINYFLEDMYLQTKINKGDTNADTGAKDCFLVDMAGAFAFTRVRITYQGNTLWDATPEWCVISQYLRANHEKSIQLDAMLSDAEFNVNPDDAQSVEITFKPTEAPTFDFSTSS